MNKIFEPRNLTACGNVLSRADFRLFSDIDYDFSKALAVYGPSYVAEAEKILDKPYSQVLATRYLEYVRNGNRSNCEGDIFSRRSMVITFALAELYERKGRFTDRIIDGLWLIMEESTWIIPAHIRTQKGLPLQFATEDGDAIENIDLFSATTGGCMAFLWYWLGDVLDEQVPIIRQRLLAMLHQRILRPFYNFEKDWWQGADGKRGLNNWTPWIISNVLTVIALCEDDDALREAGVQKALTILDRFTAPYPSDGGCDEGPSYWNVAGASYFDCAEILYDLTGGKINIFDAPLLRNMCKYIMNVSITKHTYVNFADAPSRLSPNARMIARMGRRLENPRLVNFANSLDVDAEYLSFNTSSPYRAVRDMTEKVPAREEFIPEERIYYPDLQVAVTNDKVNNFFLAIKGGSNNESHNHNDVGQFILFRDGKPLIMDAGVETYCRDTFSAKRYTLWAMRAAYHNIPEINGCEEQVGGQYRAQTLAYDEKSGRMTLELNGAYPQAAGVVSYIRSAGVENGVVTVTEKMELAAPSPVVFHLLTVDKPTVEGNTLTFATGEKLTFSPELAYSVDEVDLKNGKIAREWQRETLWRINLAAENVKTGEFELKVEA